MDSILMKIYECYSGDGRNLLLHAYDFAKEAHRNQKRASGEPYFIHPCAVAEILIELGLDAETIAAALLHDVIEDTPYQEEDIRREFGEEVLTLVSGVTKLDKIEFKSREEEEAENFRKIFLAMAQDIRVIVIKLADRLHNMRSLNFLSADRQQKMAQETLDIYAPIAGRLGISQVKCELEDLCLKYLEPNVFEFLVENIHQKLEERRRFVESVVEDLKKILEEDNINGEVFGRPKHFYSIYKKMKTKGKSLDQIYDLTAVRVIVGTVDECYTVLGKIHKKWKPVPGRVKDYIAIPKTNLYQSLHTTVLTNFGQPFEIQIRTEEMHRTAEYGIAAHWKYKENRIEETSLDQKIGWIREIMEVQGGMRDSKEFLDTVKGTLVSKELLVFTPQGKVIALPGGATPVDFAYAIHTEVGNRCTGAKVNGKIVPLNSPIETGDVIEIITSSSNKGPSRDWLRFVKSSSARAKIKSYFRKQMKDDNIRLGKTMLEEAVKKKGYKLSDVLTNESFKTVSAKYAFESQDEMFASVGCGSINVNQILVKLTDYIKKTAPRKFEYRPTHRKEESNIRVMGMESVLTLIAGCCAPVPGDEIVAYVTRGRGAMIHRKSCPNVKNMEPERLCEAEWLNQEGGKFKSSFAIYADNLDKAMGIAYAVKNEMNLEVINSNGRYDKNNVAVYDMSVWITKREEIDVFIKKMKAHPGIIDVQRVIT